MEGHARIRMRRRGEIVSDFVVLVGSIDFVDFVDFVAERVSLILITRELSLVSLR